MRVVSCRGRRGRGGYCGTSRSEVVVVVKGGRVDRGYGRRPRRSVLELAAVTAVVVVAGCRFTPFNCSMRGGDDSNGRSIEARAPFFCYRGGRDRRGGRESIMRGNIVHRSQLVIAIVCSS